MLERRKSDRRIVAYAPHNTVWMTVGFMFGMIIGALIHTDHSPLSIVTSVTAATLVFHFTFVRSINFPEKIARVIKKGS